MRLEMKTLEMACGGEDSNFEYTDTCPDCYGAGYTTYEAGGFVFMLDCNKCNGTGKVQVHRGASGGW